MIWLMITSLVVTGSIGLLAFWGIAPVNLPVLGWILMFATVANFIIIMDFRQRIEREKGKTKMFRDYVVYIRKRARDALYPGFNRRGYFATMDSHTKAALDDIEENCKGVLDRYDQA